MHVGSPMGAPVPCDLSDIDEVEPTNHLTVSTVAPALVVVFEVDAPMRVAQMGDPEIDFPTLHTALEESETGRLLLIAIHARSLQEWERGAVWAERLDRL